MVHIKNRLRFASKQHYSKSIGQVFKTQSHFSFSPLSLQETVGEIYLHTIEQGSNTSSVSPVVSDDFHVKQVMQN